MDKLKTQIAYHNLACDYTKTLALLRALKMGEVTLEQITVFDNGWGFVSVTESAHESNGELPPALAERLAS